MVIISLSKLRLNQTQQWLRTFSCTSTRPELLYFKDLKYRCEAWRWSWAVVRSEQTNLGHLLGHAYRTYDLVNADFGVMNSGGVRDSIQVGDVGRIVMCWRFNLLVIS